MTRRLLAPAVLVLGLCALPACGGGGSDSACSAQLSYEGRSAQASGADRFAARHAACRAWCVAATPGVPTDSDEVTACASRCSADLLFGKATAAVSCN